MAAPARADPQAAKRLTSPIVARLLALTPEQRQTLLEDLPSRIRGQLLNTWSLWARPSQIYTPSEYLYDVVNGGRGGGKSSTGLNALIHVSRHTELCGGRNGRGGRNGVAARTFSDIYQLITDEESGLMRWCPPDFRPRYIEQKHELRWPNGCRTRLFTGDSPGSFRGPNIGWLWADELAHWIKLRESWPAAIGMVRLGAFPRILITTTPTGVDELLQVIFEMLDGAPVIAPPDTDPERTLQGFLLNPQTRVTTISMFDNAANLPEGYITNMVKVHAAAGTAGQELDGVVGLGSPNALWHYRWIRREAIAPEPLDIITLGIDPAKSSSPTGSEWGLVIVAIGRSGTLYVLADLSGHLTPTQVGERVAFAISEFGVGRIAYEDNAGGDLIEAALRPTIAPELLARAEMLRVTATRDAGMRAAIVAPLWNVGRVIHVGDARAFVALEHQQRNFDPSKPKASQPSDRMDALVWAVLDLVAGGSDREAIAALGDTEAWDRVLSEVRRRIAAG